MTKTIWDHEVAEFGSGNAVLDCPFGRYSVSFDQADQSRVDVVIDGEHHDWWLLHKEVDDTGVIHVCGMSVGSTQSWGDVYWFDLEFGQIKAISYYGNQGLIRKDNEVLG